MRSSALVANGLLESSDSLRASILAHDRIVAVDGGLRYLVSLGIDPYLIVGDMDSSLKEHLKKFPHAEKVSLKKEKDETDLEVALSLEIERGSQKITLFGAWGKRADHSLTNALILGRYPEILKMETGGETLFAIHKKKEISCRVGQTLSLLPIYGPARGITTTGLRWELKKGELDLEFIGISNICLQEKITISVEEGLLLCSLLKD